MIEVSFFKHNIRNIPKVLSEYLKRIGVSRPVAIHGYGYEVYNEKLNLSTVCYPNKGECTTFFVPYIIDDTIYAPVLKIENGGVKELSKREVASVTEGNDGVCLMTQQLRITAEFPLLQEYMEANEIKPLYMEGYVVVDASNELSIDFADPFCVVGQRQDGSYKVYDLSIKGESKKDEKVVPLGEGKVIVACGAGELDEDEKGMMMVN